MLKNKRLYLSFLALALIMTMFVGCEIEKIVDGQENETFDPARHNGYISFKLDDVLRIYHDQYEDTSKDMSSVEPGKNQLYIDAIKYGTGESLKVYFDWQGENAGKVKAVKWQPTMSLCDIFDKMGDDFVGQIDNYDLSTGLITGSFSGRVYRDAVGTGPYIEIKEGFFHIKHEFELPILTIQSPAAGATVSGNVTISGKASDDTGVEGVEIFIYENFGSQDLLNKVDADGEESWKYIFDSTGLANGEYKVLISARDKHWNYSLVGERVFNIQN